MTTHRETTLRVVNRKCRSFDKKTGIIEQPITDKTKIAEPIYHYLKQHRLNQA